MISEFALNAATLNKTVSKCLSEPFFRIVYMESQLAFQLHHWLFCSMSRSVCARVFEAERNRDLMSKVCRHVKMGGLQHRDNEKHISAVQSRMEARETETETRERERKRGIQREGERDGDKRARHSFHIKCLGYSSTKVYFIKVMPPCSRFPQGDYLSNRPGSLIAKHQILSGEHGHTHLERRERHWQMKFCERPALFRLFPSMHLPTGHQSQAFTLSCMLAHESKYSHLDNKCSLHQNVFFFFFS